MNMKRIVCSAFLLGLLPFQVLAQETGSLDDSQVQAPDEPVVTSDYQTSEEGPQIVIRPGDNKVFYEYRVNGELREIKVVPETGPAYYLVPADGGGWIREDETDMLIPSWVLFRW
ncbi:hypothetical protein HNR38_001316 [Marinobacter oulmenensis]|uniref:DUF2782 domain-containing protein n=2 Tax=Marinobacter oulmenensis TaxID=643747 RepID=A0A840UC44_9GAMM|nr:hypothetical protein [Marinobacter oulmenensis]